MTTMRALSSINQSLKIHQQVLVEVKQVMHPLCSTLTVLDITDTSVTNYGLLTILRRMPQVHSLGEFSISDAFLRSLCVVTSLKMDKFGLHVLHTRKISSVGIYNMVHVFPHVRSFTCWDPQFDISDMSYFGHLRHLTLLRIPYSENALHQIMRYIERNDTSSAALQLPANRLLLERVCLEFVMQDDYLVPNNAGGGLGFVEFNLARIFGRCKGLRVFSVDFKEGLMATPPVGYSCLASGSGALTNSRPNSRTALDTLVYVQLGQVVQNCAVTVILQYSPHLKQFHCNMCPDLQDIDIAACVARSVNEGALECFYVYEAPRLTFDSFQMLVEGFPSLQRFGNLTRWAINCEGMQQVVHSIRDNNLDVEILCGSHWFSSTQCGKCSMSAIVP